MTKARNNPFATHRIRTIRYMPQTCTWDDLVARLRSMNCRAAIVGPCGSGKTTLAEDLSRRLAEMGRTCRTLFITLDIKVPLRRITAALNAGDYDTLLIDGADHLNPFLWNYVKRRTARTHRGLIITSHRPGLLPTLIECATSPQLLQDITNTLVPDTADPHLIHHLHHKYRGNIREALRELYDLTASDSHTAAPPSPPSHSTGANTISMP